MAALSLSFFQEHWRDFKRGKPGRRFQDRYERARQGERKHGIGVRIALYAGALVCLAIGVVLTVFPGPAVPFFFVAGGLLATESRVLARFMDACEVRGRKVAAWGRRHWRRMHPVARVSCMILGGCCSMAGAYLSFRLMRG